ncbi:ATP-binding protein [Chloroflexota bacterium]
MSEQVKTAAVIDVMIDGVTITDMQGRVIDANKAVIEQFGYEREETIGETPGELFIVEKERPRFFEATKFLLSGKPIEASDYLCKRKDGMEFPVSVSLSLLRDTEGRPNAIVAVSRDITERKRMEREIQDKNEQLEATNEELRSANEELQASEEELRAANEELQTANEELGEAQEQLVRSEKLAAIGQLAGGVGHELRNPLGAIKNAVYYVRGKVSKSELGQQEPRVIEFLNIMDDEVNSSNKIINDLLGFSRVGKSSVSPTCIEKVVEDALSHTPIPESIEVIKKVDVDLPEVEVDPDQIHQVLVNILINAVQAMPEGGKLTLTDGQEDGFLEVKIADTGCGIPKEAIEKIFDPLYTMKAKGIGFGLAVCKSIIDRHQGHIEVESEVGKGTVFTVKLPLMAIKDRGGK